MRMVHTGLVSATCFGCLSAVALAQTAPAPRPPQNYPPQNYQQQNPNYTQPRTASVPRGQEYGPQPPAGYGQGAQGAPQQAPRQSAPGQPAGPAQAPPTKPAPPFVLTPEQQAGLDQILLKWEQHSQQVNIFICKFNRWDYNVTFGPANNNYLNGEGKGEIKFKSPDCGVYRVEAMKEWDGKQYTDKKEGLDHWVCDGTSIYELQSATKRLIVRELPPGMRGKAIADGPLPFIFGANAATLKRRYLMRDVTPPEFAAKQIWLEAYPRYQSDAANFQRVEFILTREDYSPYALQIYMPMGKDRTVYQFKDIQINPFLGTLQFAAPHTPFGWKKEVISANPPTAQQPPKQPPFQPVQAQRPGVAPTK